MKEKNEKQSNELIKLIKGQSEKAIGLQVKSILEDLKRTKDFKDLESLLSTFESDPYSKELCDFYIDESGSLNSTIELSLHFLEDFEPEVLDAVIEELEKFCCVYLHQYQYSQDRYSYRADICLGEPTIYNESPYRDCYAIYSRELDLKVEKVLSESHGYALIEQAMRKSGVFENIISTDYYGNFCGFLSVPKDIRELSDSALSELIESIESPKQDEEEL